jgi:hypothetical protein
MSIHISSNTRILNSKSQKLTITGYLSLFNRLSLNRYIISKSLSLASYISPTLLGTCCWNMTDLDVEMQGITKWEALPVIGNVPGHKGMGNR